MALTIALVKRTVFGDQQVAIADVTFDSSYPANGEALDLGQLGLGTVNFMQVPQVAGYMLAYDYASKKIKVYLPTAAHTHTETGSTTDENTAAVADEVADTTDLSALTVRLMAYGN